MEQVTPRAVAEFVARIAPMYVDDPVTVELLPLAAGCPFRASIVWDGDKWYILGDLEEDPHTLCHYLFHELAHVVYGDVTKESTGKAALRLAALGIAGQADRAFVQRTSRATRQSNAARAREDRANDWAAAQVAGWWGTLRDWKDPTKAAQVAWWVHRELQKGA